MENIALAFSGGGFRATCFSLGSLSYLNHIQYKGNPLLQNVKFISSTSGGSITNLVYCSFIFQGRSFNECYQHLITEMDGEKLNKNKIFHLFPGMRANNIMLRQFPKVIFIHVKCGKTLS